MTETEHVECYPVPANVEEKGRAQGYYPDCSVVYIRILWKEFEPKEGVYKYEFIEDILRKAKENNQTVMFRLMQHSTRESDDVPDWLKTKIECPARPEGMRVKDCPKDSKFLEYFGRAVRSFGERFDSDPTLAFVDISLPGPWGEGSHVDWFTQEQLARFVDIYTDVFKNTLLIGQTCIPWLVQHSNGKTSMGWRADRIGKPNLTYEMLPPKVEKMGDIWKKGHVSFEAYWWIGEWKRQGWDLDKIMQTLLSWYISTFNAKSLPIPWEWKDKIDEWIAKMGYHFVIDEIETETIVKRGETLAVRLVIDNVGVAPIYYKLPLYIRLKNANTEKTFETDIDIRRWIEGKYVEEIILDTPEDLPSGEYELQIGIGGNGGRAWYLLATQSKTMGNTPPSKENKMLLNIFLSTVFTSNLLEFAVTKEASTHALRRMFNNSNRHINEELIAKMWKKIDTTEFSEIVLAKKHSLFSLNNWSRKNNGKYLEPFED